MTNRERFESIISASPYEKSVARWPNLPVKFAWPGGYKDLNVDLAWWMWQASRKQALEEAIQLCFEQIDPESQFPDFQGGWSTGAESCRDAIREIANPEGEQG